MNCIDAWMVYGGTSTVFFKNRPRYFKEIPGVDLLMIIERFTLLTKKGKNKTLKKEKIKDLEVYTRFKNFNPLIEDIDPE